MRGFIVLVGIVICVPICFTG